MSADLFAEFGAAPAQQQQQPAAPQQPASTFSFFDDQKHTPQAPAKPQQAQPPAFQWPESNHQNKVQSDDWGDFEAGSSFQPAPTPASQDLFGSTSSQQQHLQWQPAPVIKAKKSADPSVLFDAEDDLDDDDFGDFEGEGFDSSTNEVLAPAPPRSTGFEDLLGDMTISQPQHHITSTQAKPKPQAQARRTSPIERSQMGAFGASFPSKQEKRTPTPPVVKQEESWDSFDDWESSIPKKMPSKAGPVAAEATNAPVFSIPTPGFDDEVQPGELPPTNVPPPAVLMSLFPPLFSDAQNTLFKPMAAQTLPMRNKLLSEPATISFLQAYLVVASVAARIIAGRKLRWKRDSHLSQGMRIGPASSRATSGMKLTGIDRSENMKEEREAADVVRAWKEQIGRLRHVVSAVNQAKADALGAVPDIQETMPVKMLKQAEGGVPAPRPCMLCGLKREERVTAADRSVEDSFGEWWIDQTNMHRGCRNFWNEHKDTLRQR